MIKFKKIKKYQLGSPFLSLDKKISPIIFLRLGYPHAKFQNNPVIKNTPRYRKRCGWVGGEWDSGRDRTWYHLVVKFVVTLKIIHICEPVVHFGLTPPPFPLTKSEMPYFVFFLQDLLLHFKKFTDPLGHYIYI